MTSSTLTGERRWATARRGGMTVLGKVAAPKPINLPSQRLENHGLDPNVEIVPKGTHSWGSKSSSSTTNAWGSSSTSSPNNDGTGSPNYLTGRPSSGGSGTRPSTAGSERAQEPNSNAWGSNSRPSSASGALTSSQSSLTSLRPRSAETRPGSSQLSRFAEPLTDSSVAWGANRTAEKLGMASAKNDDGFSLTTGDFPTLGSEKETSGKTTESQDHGPQGRPGSSSGGVAHAKEMTGNSVGDDDGNSNIRNGTSNSWRRESHMYGEDGTRNNAEKWHQDLHPYPKSNIPPQQYDAWCGPPVNSHPGGVWYRGPPPPGGPPFGSPVGPGGFPMEPFPYYRPQIPPGALTNLRAVPPPGAGPRGPRPKNGDMYRPHMPDAYMRPGMPIRPGFYPGPVPYDGYYGPPMGYCNSNERDISFMGMPMGPAAYNPYSGQNVPDASNSRGRGYGPSSKGLVSEQMESSHPQDARGPYKVLLKQHDGWEGRDEQKQDKTATVPYPGKGDHPKKSSWENGWRANHKEEEMDTRRMTIRAEGLSESADNQGGVYLEVPERVGQLKASDDASVKDIEQGEPVTAVLPKVSPLPREPSLIQKIEGLNAKARASDGRQDVLSASSRVEQKNKFQASDEKNNASVNEAAIVSVTLGNTDLNTASCEGGISVGGKGVESMVFGGTTTSRRSTHGVHGGADRRGRGRINPQETDGWRKKPQAADPPSVVSPTVQVESSVVHWLDNTSAGAIEKPGSHSQVKNGGSLPLMSDPSDSQSQRARMTELAKQRLKQREKEEEEREREQRAKALAKLEELNRRTLAGEVSSQKQETVPSSAIGSKQEESSAHVQPAVVGGKSRGQNSVLGPSPSAVVQSIESSVKGAEISLTLSRNVSQTTSNTVHKESHSAHGNSVPVHNEANNSSSGLHENEPHAYDIDTSKQKRYRQKQQSSVEKNSVEKSSASATEPSKGDAGVAANVTVSPENMAHDNVLNCESSLPVNQGVMSEPSIHHKRKNRSGKSKHNVEEASSNVCLPSKDNSASDVFVQSNKAKDAESMQDPSPVEATVDSKDANQPSDHVSVLPNEEVHVRVNNQWKSQYPRKPLRNPHSNRSAEKFQGTDAVVWAPVRSNKNEVSDEASQRPTDAVSMSVKNDHQVQNNPRNKRAEMERYVPKPAAKEMSQQGSSHQSVTSSINQMTSDETIGKSESSPLGNGNSQSSSPVAGKAGSTVEYRHGDGRQNKSGKAHGAWRQRATAESAAVTSNTNRNVQNPTEHHQHRKTDLSSVKEHSRRTDEWSTSDGWNILEKSDAPVNVPVAKEQGVVVKGKRYKAAGYSHHLDEKRVNSGVSEKVSVQQSSTTEMKQSQLHATSKENRSVGDRSGSHWQPKANASSAINEQGSRSNNGQNVIAEFNTANKKDSTSQGGESLPPQLNKERAVSKAQHHQDSNVEDVQGVGHQEPKRGRKMDVHDRRPVSPVDSSPSNIGARHEQRGSSGFRKNESQNSRFGREHEYNGDWSGSAKDSKQHNAPAQREKQRQSSHYEYQPVGADNNRTGNTVPTNDGSRNSYGRYKERGQAHPRRGGGNSNGRQTGNVLADASYE